MRRWEVVSYTMDENFCTDRTVPPRVLARYFTHWGAERACYRSARARAVSTMSPEVYRQHMVLVRREGDWDTWNYVKQYGDRGGATEETQ